MKKEFLAAARNRNQAVVEPLFARLLTSYSQPHRYYHNLIHLEHGLEIYFSLFPQISPNDMMAWAYHDYYYEPLSSDNEERSAGRFMGDYASLGFDLETADGIAQQILGTKHTGAHVSIVNDLDLSILGSDAETYRRYAQNIRREYNVLPDEAFNQGRAQVLMHLLERPYIYNNGVFREKFEKQARSNLENEVKELLQIQDPVI